MNKDYINSNRIMRNIMINKLKLKFDNNKIPKDIIEKINYYKKLDEEYLVNCETREIGEYYLFEYDRIINKNWRGVFLKCTGIDEFLFIQYILIGMETKKNENELMLYFKKKNPEEKYIPNCVIDGIYFSIKYR